MEGSQLSKPVLKAKKKKMIVTRMDAGSGSIPGMAIQNHVDAHAQVKAGVQGL